MAEFHFNFLLHLRFTESAPWQWILTRKKSTVRIESHFRSRLYCLDQHKSTHLARELCRCRFEEKDPDVTAIIGFCRLRQDCGVPRYLRQQEHIALDLYQSAARSYIAFADILGVDQPF